MMEESRKQFEAHVLRLAKEKNYAYMDVVLLRSGDEYATMWVDTMWQGWQASRAAMEPVCWRTYYPDTDEDSGRAHSESGAESCAKRIASEIGGYVVPVYYGDPQQGAAGLKIKGD